MEEGHWTSLSIELEDIRKFSIDRISTPGVGPSQAVGKGVGDIDRNSQVYMAGNLVDCIHRFVGMIALLERISSIGQG